MLLSQWKGVRVFARVGFVGVQSNFLKRHQQNIYNFEACKKLIEFFFDEVQLLFDEVKLFRPFEVWILFDGNSKHASGRCKIRRAR